jgi:hypothetical protein
MATHGKQNGTLAGRTKRNSGDTKGYAEENPGRHHSQSGKDAKTRKAAENVGTGKRKSVR